MKIKLLAQPLNHHRWLRISQVLYGRIADEEETLRVLQAEWSFLTQPDRIQGLSQRYLALDTPVAKQIGGIDRIPFRAPDEEVAHTAPKAKPTR